MNFSRSQKRVRVRGTTRVAVLAVCTRPTSSGRAILATSAKSSVTKEVGRLIHKELVYLNKKEALSTFGDSSVKTLTTYTWDELWEEASQCCPILTTILSMAAKHKVTTMQTATLCTIVAMLSKLHNQKANMVQSMISCMLYSGGCNMKVWYSTPLLIQTSNMTNNTIMY